MSATTRLPKPPPFKIGTRLRYVGDRHITTELAGREVDIVKRGMVAEITKVFPGRRGTGAQLRDEDGPMHWDDTGEPMLDETQDGYSVWTNVAGQGHIIRRECVSEWEVVKVTRYYVLFRSSFAYESAPNISHELENATSERTYCGRRGWETYEPDDNNLEPDCIVCRRASLKRRSRS